MQGQGSTVSRAGADEVMELRQYTLHPGRRDELIDVFDREFVETQEAVGIEVVGQFRDLDRPDRFVWVRRFAGMESRLEGLDRFYGGPAWAAHGLAASATMIDFSDVLLLRPAAPGSGLPRSDAARAPVDRLGGGAHHQTRRLVVATVHHVRRPCLPEAAGLFAEQVVPALQEHGGQLEGWYQTEPAENTYPALPVRTDVTVLVSFTTFSSIGEYAAHLAGQVRGWDHPSGTSPDLLALMEGPPQRLHLAPTARSKLGAGT